MTQVGPSAAPGFGESATTLESVATGHGGAVVVPVPIADTPPTLSDAKPERTDRAAQPASGVRSRRRVGGILAAVVGSHAVVDYYSFIIVALMPLLAARLDLTNQQKAMLLAIGSIMSGFLQPLMAWLGDRRNSRAIAWIGLMVAAVACSGVGLAQGFWSLLLISAIGAAGVGVFHPPAAAVVGQLSGKKRSLGVSLFFLAGMAGGMGGNVLAPYFVRWAGHAAGGTGDASLTLGLQWQCVLIVPGIVVALLLARAIGNAPHRQDGAHDAHAALPARERRRRWAAVWILYAANVTRFITNTALVYLFLRWIETLTEARLGEVRTPQEVAIAASVLNGKFQAAMQLGMGGAGLLAGWVLHVRHEKASLIAVPLVGAVAIAGVPLVSTLDLSHGASVWIGLGLAVMAGVGFGGTVPTVISIAQRLLPHRTALASGLMMGGAWGVGFIGPPMAEKIERAAGLDVSFYVTASLLLVCAALGASLPGRVIRDA